MKDPRIIAALNALAEANGGRLTPDEVVEAARAKDSPLHDYFAERDAWDAKKAQAHHCRQIARELIRSIRVEVTTTKWTMEAPVYVRDPSAAPRQGYTSLSRLRTDADLAREVVVSEFSRASAALKRAQAVAAALDLSDEIGTIREQLDGLMRKAEITEDAHADH